METLLYIIGISLIIAWSILKIKDFFKTTPALSEREDIMYEEKDMQRIFSYFDNKITNSGFFKKLVT